MQGFKAFLNGQWGPEAWAQCRRTDLTSMGHGTAGEGALHPGAIEFKRARDRSPTLEQVRISTGRGYPRTLPPQTPAQGAVHGKPQFGVNDAYSKAELSVLGESSRFSIDAR